MATNPYTSVSISGYNDNPPADDASEVADNQVEWAKHKTKLGDPVKNLSESINTNALSAFGKTINTDSDQSNAMGGSLAYTSSELTISGGSITITRGHHSIDTQSDGASDDLDTIVNSGTADGAVVYLRLENASRVVTIKDNTGNIQTKNNEDLVLDANIPTILMRVGTSWFEIQRSSVDNPFDQSLNTTDNPTFGEITASTGINLGGSAAANLLDDYEEGTFTPTLTGSSPSGSIVYVIRSGKYTKIGDLVTSVIEIRLSSKASHTGDVTITGYPFTAGDDFNSGVAGFVAGFASTAGFSVSGFVLTGTTTVSLQRNDATAGDTNLQISELSDTGRFKLTIIYRV